MNVDLPALGIPNKPTSASTFNSSLRFFFSPGQPGVFCRGAVDGALEAQVAKAAVAALGNRDHVARIEQLVEHLTRFGIGDDGADRHLQGDVGACGTEHVGAHAVLAALGFVPARVAVVHQGVEVRVRHGEHMAPTSAVAAVGAAEFLVFLVPERHAAIAAITGSNVNKGFVDELHGISSLQKEAAPADPIGLPCLPCGKGTPFRCGLR
jgi:hypothetical protein